MSEQEEYLDRLLKGLTEEPEDTLEDFALEDEDLDIEGLEDIDEEEFFKGESGELEDMDSQLLADFGEALGLSEEEEKEPEFNLEESELLEFAEAEEKEPEYDSEEAGESEFAAEESEFAADLETDSEMGSTKELERLLDAYSADEKEEPMSETEAFDSELDEAEVLETPLEETEIPDEAELLETPLEETEIPDEAEVLETPLEETEIPDEAESLETMMEETEIPEEIEPEENEAADMEAEIADIETEADMEAEEIDDEQALANVLSRFADEEEAEEEVLQDEPFQEEENPQDELSDGEEALQDQLLGEEQDEEPLAEEAVLEAPQNLGLELEEVEEPLEEAEEGPRKKKKKEKKAKKEKREKNQEKKPSLFARLLEDNADDEPTPEELEAEAAKKAEKKEQKQAKKEEAAEKKQQAKEAAAAKKAEKEAEKKRKKEMEEPPEPWPPFTKKIIPMIFLFGATIVAVIIILSNVLSYSPYISTARQYFDDRQYGKAYEQLMGIELREKDQKFFDQVFLMNQLQIKVVSSKNHLLNKEKELAVNDLVQAVRFYHDNLEKAAGLGLEKEFQVVYAEIEAALSESFGISTMDAEELGSITDAKEYQSRIAEIIQ